MATFVVAVWSVFSLLIFDPVSGWDSGQEYVFEYNARAVSGLWDLKMQFATLAIKSKVTVQSIDQRTLRLKMSDVVAKVHANYEGNPYYEEQEATDFKNLDIDIGGQQVDIEQLEQLEAPCDIIHSSGSVSAIIVSSADPSWSVNLKKGLVSQLQLNISRPGSAKSAVKIYEDSSLETNIAVDVYEHSITGHCKVNLQISRLPEALIASHSVLKKPSNQEICREGNVYEVIKTKDFDQCQTNPMLNFLTPSTLNCKLGSARCGEALQRTAFYKYLGCGETPESMTLISYEGYGELFAKPFLIKTEQLVHTVISTLNLQSRQPITQQLNAPSNPRRFESLDHVYPENDVPEGSSVEPDLYAAARHGSEKESALLQTEGLNLLREVAQNLKTSSKSDVDIVDRLDVVSKGLGLLSVSQLNETWTAVKKEGQTVIRDLFLHALVSSGSNPAVLFLKELIEDRELVDSTASILLATLGHNLRTPTRPLLQQLMDLLKTELVQSSQELRRSLSITLGGILNSACVSANPSQYTWALVRDRCTARDPIIVDQFLPLLKENLSSAEENIDYYSALLALSKLGSADILPILLPHIQGSDTGDDTARRTMAIAALAPLARSSSQQVLPLLVSLADNVSERPEVRMMAISLCFHSNAPLVIWQKLAYRTWFESNRQVAAFIYSTLKAVSEIALSSPGISKLVDKAKTVLPLSKPTKELDNSWSGSSTYSSFIEEGFGFSTTFTRWVQPDVPSPVFRRVSSMAQYGPLLAAHSLERWEFGAEQISQLLPGRRLKRSTAPRQLFAAGFSELDTLWAQNRLLRRSDDLKANILHLNLFNSIHRIFDVENLYSGAKSFFPRSQQPRVIDSTFYLRLTEFDLQLPSDIGIPIRLTTKASVLLSLSGSLGYPGSVKIDAGSVLAEKFSSELRSDLPFCRKYIASGVDGRMDVRGPRGLEVGSRVTWKPHDQVTDFFYYHVKPYTTSRDISSPTPVTEAAEFHSVRVNPQKERTLFFLPNSWGIDLRLSHETDADYEDLTSWQRFFGQWDLKLFLQLGAVPLSLRNQVYRLRFHPETSSADEVTLGYSESGDYREDSSTVYFTSGTQLKRPDNPHPNEDPQFREIQSGTRSTKKFDAGIRQKDGSSVKFQAALNGIHGEDRVAYQAVLENIEGDEKSTVCVTGKANWNNLPSFGLSSDALERFIQLNISTGASCDSVVGVINITASRNAEAKTHVRDSDSGKTCMEQSSSGSVDSPQCSEARLLDGTYNQYEISTDIADVIVWMPFVNPHPTHLLSRYITSIGPGNHGNLWAVKMVRNPQSSDLDVEIRSPEMTALAQNVRTLDWKLAPFLKNWLNSLLQTKVSDDISDSERCYINSKRIITFDKVPYEYGLNSCYHTLVTDCTKQKRFVILGRSFENRLILRVVTDKDVIDIDPAGSVNINGVTEALDGLQKYVIDEQGVRTVSVKRGADGVIRVALFRVEVKLSASQITITPPVSLKGKVCGLCGDFDKEVVGEFKTGSRCLVSSGALMASSFQVSFNDNCPDVSEDLANELKSQTTICYSPDERIRSALPLSFNI